MSWANWIERNEEGRVFEIQDLKYLAEYVGVKNRSRQHDIIILRYCLWDFAKKNTGESLERIGAITGHNHSTVLNGLKRLKGWEDTLDKLTTRKKQQFVEQVKRFAIKERIINYEI